MKQQTTIKIGSDMILANGNAVTAMRFYRSRNGKLQLRVGKDIYPISQMHSFEFDGSLCRVEIYRHMADSIRFSVSGRQELLLVVPQEGEA